jgi:glycine cleavage system H lipoate-binding protein
MRGPGDRDTAADAPCVWMLAGVLNYRLCDRNYECETCELYHALHGDPASRPWDETGDPLGSAGTSDLADRYLRRLTVGCALHLDRSYSRGHFWIEQRPEDGQLDVGIAEHVLRVLHPLDDLVMPRTGVRLKRGEPCGWLTRGRVSVPLAVPLAGDVRARNEEAIDAVRRSGGLSDGRWLFRIEPLEDPYAVPGLAHGEEAIADYLATLHLLRRYLEEALAPPETSEVGHTMADGGSVAPNLELVLGRERFERLVDELFRVHI